MEGGTLSALKEIKVFVGETLEGRKKKNGFSLKHMQIQKISTILETLKLWTNSLRTVVIPLRGEGC